MYKRKMTVVGLLLALVMLFAAIPPAAAQTAQPETTTWEATYWNGSDLTGAPALVREEVGINHDWGFGSPAAAINADNFSARWTTSVHLDPGTYRFVATSDDGVRVRLDGTLIIDNWLVQPADTVATEIELDGGTYDLAVEYFEYTGLAEISFTWHRLNDVEESVSISPTSGPPGTIISVSASGFTPGDQVTVGVGRTESEPTSEKTVQADEQGNVNTTIMLPTTAEPGEPWAVLVISGSQSALSQTFTVTAGDDGPCGDTYVVQPGDWLASIARRCNVSLAALLEANPQITDPAVIHPGDVLVIPAVNGPVVAITPESGPAGTLLVVEASGFPPNSEVTVTVSQTTADAEAAAANSRTAATDANGELVTNIVLPPTAAPGQTWQVSVIAGDVRADSAAFTVTAEEVLATMQYNLNMRVGPGTEFEDFDVIPAGTTVPVLARTEASDWILVEYQERRGWVAAWLTNIDGNLLALPVLAE